MRSLELRIPPLLVWLIMAGAMLGVAYAALKLSFTLAGGSEARTLLFKDYADGHFMTVYGDPSQQLLDLLKGYRVGHQWFCFLQGLAPSPVMPSVILGADREAEQPV